MSKKIRNPWKSMLYGLIVGLLVALFCLVYPDDSVNKVTLMVFEVGLGLIVGLFVGLLANAGTNFSAGLRAALLCGLFMGLLFALLPLISGGITLFVCLGFALMVAAGMSLCFGLVAASIIGVRRIRA